MKRTTKNILKDFFQDGTHIAAEAGEIIYNSDTNQPELFLISDGFVKSYTIRNDGELNILNFYGPDSIFPLSPVLRRALDWDSFRVRETIYFEAMTSAAVYRRKADEFDLTSQSTDVYQEIIYRLLQNYDVYLNCTQSQQFRYARERIIYQLLMLAGIFGADSHEGTIINLPLTHYDLGSTIGMARETVSRELEKLRAQGLILTNNYHITLVNRETLEHELESTV